MKRLLALPLLLAAGCAQNAIAPSLARRPIESRDLNAPPAEAAAPAAADAALAREIATLVERAEAGQRAFAALLPRAQSAAANAGADGSESWVAAQQLLSALESSRAETGAALAGVDALLSARVQARSDAGLAELQAAAQRIGALAEAQQDVIDSLRARISR
ncbi:hypothetical protein [Sphingomonas sp.]|jgi:hypothetical protein|uniref:hypothetical protein n=1 Tax=Sphingomonas sp. TaxID=28214 RepID=UPI002DECEA3E|nr:hypothetical protein [Sphingomonas sp.]